ncbi:hypothetical protein [Terrimonas pollutisoli]|uniref:hypothetical protein n=1 Tax=Terrimonas pollutisoli TaxID=3034147 RepID=UPI0023EABE7A|nr:hypothetical protein [Terrimonas sp. H1YJ31]
MPKAKKTTPPKPAADKNDEKLTAKGRSADPSKIIKKNKEDKKKPDPYDFEDDQALDERELGGEG